MGKHSEGHTDQAYVSFSAAPILTRSLLPRPQKFLSAVPSLHRLIKKSVAFAQCVHLTVCVEAYHLNVEMPIYHTP